MSNVTAGARRARALYAALDAGAIRLGRALLRRSYRRVASLDGPDVTATGFVDALARLCIDDGTRAVDVFLNVHGVADALLFLDGAVAIDDLARRVAALPERRPLRLLYSTACHGAGHAPHFVAAGFRTASGARAVNTNGEIEFPTLLRRWARGLSYADAVVAANPPWQVGVHDRIAARLAGFAGTNSDKVIAGDPSITIATPP